MYYMRPRLRHTHTDEHHSLSDHCLSGRGAFLQKTLEWVLKRDV
jgi:hypothetical protein